jgi:transcriptional regulator with XRE-family HTH domain
MNLFKSNLLYLRKKNKVTQDDMAHKLSLGRTTITNYEKGISEPSFDILIQIAKILDVTIDDLLLKDIREEDDYNADNPHVNFFIKSKTSHIHKEYEARINSFSDNPSDSVPVIPAKAQAGWSTFDVSIGEKQISQHLSIPMLNEKADFAIEVEGDSMLPYYSEGSFIVCKKISTNELQWEKPYLVIIDHAPMLKRLYPSTEDNYIVLRSDNPRFKEFMALKSSITAIAKILAVVRLNNM